MNIPGLVLAVLVMGAITFGTRVFPFIVFSKHTAGPRFKSLQRRLPSILLVILVIWSNKGTQWSHLSASASVVSCLVLAGALQYFTKNALISIFVPTIAYMILVAFLQQ